jgi:hypothetical protein
MQEVRVKMRFLQAGRDIYPVRNVYPISDDILTL